MTPRTHNPLARLRAIWLNRTEPEYARTFADLYWRGLLLTALVIVMCAAIYAALFFTSVLSELDVHAAHPGTHAASALDEQQLQATLQGLTARQSTFQSLQAGNAPRVSDPSTGD